MSKERLHVVTNPDKLFASKKGVVVEAHADDKAMGVDVGALTIVTLTNGAARNVANYTPEQLRIQRINEGIRSVEIMGGTQIYYGDLPDGELLHYQKDARIFLSEVVEKTQPDFLIAPHPDDPHVDHAIAAEVTKAVAEDVIPIYFMDTITGNDKNGQQIVPTHYIPLSQRAIRKRNRAYLANESQVTNLPPHELRDVHAVLRMPRRRGREIGEKFAGVLVHHNPSLGDPVEEILGGNVFILERTR